jgi:long-chain acyl-CoA synthetase|tara:strand:+ start:9741 stop:11390 length:1650 start_codon:yes stop_codon:yes gene_type:complete
MESILKSPVENFIKWEKNKGNNTFLIQPINGENHEFTWERVGSEARKVCKYIQSLNLPKKSKIAILSKNCAHWIITDLAIMMSGNISVPIYANVNGKTAKYILEHSESKLLFVGKLEDSDWDQIKDQIPKEIIKVNFGHYNLKCDFKKWENIISEFDPIDKIHNIKLDDIITIIYTSGTTGVPKGVVLNYKAAATATKNLDLLFPLNEKDRFISYLPLSHIAERALVEHGGILSGGKIYFVETLETFAQNLKDCKPTIFFGVPRIYTKFMSKILSIFPQSVINFIMTIPIINNIFSLIIRKALGLNKSRICITGAASIPVSTLKWFNRFEIKIYEAYGMSENSACSHGNYPNNIKFGTVGKAMPETDIKITKNGEITMKNDCIMQGYFKEDKLTNETIKNGYLHTGDKGIIDKDGYLTITGRIKDIFKTAKGKYVAPNPIEMKLSKNSFIEQVCVVGESLTQPIALVVLSEGKKIASDLKNSFEELMNTINDELESHERIKKIVILKDTWSIENNILTPTLKIKRNIVDEKYKQFYEFWFDSENKVVFQ